MKKILPDTQHYAGTAWTKKIFNSIHPQLFQNFAIGFLLLVGGKYGGFVNITWWAILTIFLTVTLTDFLLSKWLKNKTIIPLSAINSGIGIAFFIRTELLLVYALAGFMAILTKYLLSIKGKHFLNPSYTAVFLCLMLFPTIVYTDPLQWHINYDNPLPFQDIFTPFFTSINPALAGANWPVLLLILIFGSIVMLRVGLFDIMLAYTFSFFFSLYFFTTFHIEHLIILFLSGSFFIIAFFGLTDPAIIPKKRVHRILYGIQVGMLFFIFRLFINENYAFFVGYFLVNILEIFFWSLEKKYVKFGKKKFNARTFYQTIFTIFCFIIMANLSLTHQKRHNGVKPEILTNRCIRPICSWERTKGNFELLTPFFLFNTEKNRHKKIKRIFYG